MSRDLTLEKVLQTIELSAQYDLAITWIEATFPIWNEYAKDQTELSYYDGVGNHYQIETDILSKSIQLVKEERSNPGTQSHALDDQYSKLSSHILSINRLDWEPPEPVNRCYCAVYNLVQLFSGKFSRAEVEAQLNLVINQAADSLIQGQIKTVAELNHELGLVQSNWKREEEPDRGPGG